MSHPAARIFIVEDEALISMELSDRLSRLGYDVCGTAMRGDDALRDIPDSAPDLVLMDIKLPGPLSGIDIAERLRDEHDVPVVFISAFSDDQTIDRAMSAMPFGYIVKPFHERELHATVRAALTRHRLERSLSEALEALEERTLALERNERFARGVLDAISAQVAVLDEEGRIVGTNAGWRAFRAANGLEGDQLGVSYLAVCDSATGEGSADARLVAREIRKVLKGGRSTVVHEYACPTPEGERWFMCRIAPLELGDSRRVVVTHDDVTEARRVLERASAGERVFDSLSDLAPVGIFRSDAGGGCTDVSRRWSEITGLSAEKALGNGWLQAVHPEERAQVAEHWSRAVRLEEPFRSEFRFARANRDAAWVLAEAAPIPDGAGSLAGYIGTITDITERKRIEVAQRQLTTGFSGLYGRRYFETAAARLAEVLRADTAFVLRGEPGADRRMEVLTLVHEGAVREITGTGGLERLCEREDGGACEGQVVLRAAGEVFRHVPFIHEEEIEAAAVGRLSDAAGRPLGHIGVLRRTPFEDSGTVESVLKLFATAVAAEISRDRRRREYQDLFEFAPDALVLSDRNGRVRKLNRQGEAMLGWSREALVGQPIEVLIPPALREGHVALRERFAGDHQGSRVVGEAVELLAQRADGEVFPAEIHLAPVQTDEGVMIAAAIRDITERKGLQEQLSHAVKMEALGKLTGGMAHDFNNYLGVILGNLGLLKECQEWDASSRELIEGAIAGAKKGAELTLSLLAFSRRQPLMPVRTSINERLEGMTKLLSLTLGGKIGVSTVLDPDLWMVKIDAAQLDSCILNLANNARDAMPGGGRLTIRTRNVQALELPVDVLSESMELDDYVVIEVEDTGHGITSEDLARVTEPFFTTKGPGHGTGLGLSMVYGFMRQSGGNVQIDSASEEGTTVSLYFPRMVPSDDAPKG